jgi:hypothetical protein
MRVIKKKELKKTFGHRRKQVVGKRRQLHSEGLHKLYSTPNTFRVFRSRRMRYEGHIVCMQEHTNAWLDLVRIYEGKR